MKNPTNKFLKPLLLALVLMLTFGAFAQVKYSSKNGLNMVVSGTSTLHNWDMKSSQGSFDATVSFNTAGVVTSISGLSFTTPATALKSEKDAMDKNAYKALKTDKNPNISFSAATATVTAANATDFTVKAVGKLNIAGAALDAEIVATGKINADKSIAITGSKIISMKEFGMTPPSFMMGTIKTGNEVTLKFDLKLTK
jgi:hypothetical protein